MSEETLAQLPAGWHADPHGRYESRYFDGERWTLNVRDSTGGVTREQDAPALVSAPTLVGEPALVADPSPAPAADEPALVAEPTLVVEPEPVAPAGPSRAGLVVALVLLAAVVVAVAILVLARL